MFSWRADYHKIGIFFIFQDSAVDKVPLPVGKPSAVDQTAEEKRSPQCYKESLAVCTTEIFSVQK